MLNLTAPCFESPVAGFIDAILRNLEEYTPSRNADPYPYSVKLKHPASIPQKVGFTDAVLRTLEEYTT
jgi:hypothetical protein